MATRIRTIDFLPEIFKTDTNNQFLSATLDQLTQTPKFTKVQGYVGSKFGYGVQANDGYVSEPNKIRADYQLEPAVIFKKTNTNTAIDAMTYAGLLAALKIEGAITNDHERLFNNEFYSWDSFCDLDKLINYSQYYWLPQGPDPVTVTTDVVYRSGEFTVVHTNDLVYDFQSKLITLPAGNPVLTLVRGGRYTFTVNQDNPLYIQTEPGLSGTRATATNISTRDIYGLDINGLKLGTFTFDVPLATAQDNNNYPGDNSVDLVTTLKFEDIHGKKLSEIKSIDGISNNLSGKTLLFYKTNPGVTGYIGDLFDEYTYDVDNQNGVIPLVVEVTATSSITNGITCADTTGFKVNSSIYFTGIPFGGLEENKNYYITTIDGNDIAISETLSGDPITLTTDSTNANGNLYINVNVGGLEEGKYTTITNNFYKITCIGDVTDPTIKLSEHSVIPDNEKITAQFGTQYNTRIFVRNTYGEISIVPIITANRDTLYYQDGINADQFGTIILIDQPSNVLIDVERDILGKKIYKSPANITFTNGLKVKFDGNITPIRYKEDQYYVEGVGTDEGISLLPVSEQLVPEPYGQGFVKPFDISSYDTDPYGNALLVPYESDYITINRNSRSKNPWSRSNRWFHIDVLELTLSRNNNSPLVTSALSDVSARAKRPIIEFYPNIKLFNSGSVGKIPVDYIDFTTDNAFTLVAGKYESTIDLNNYKPDGGTSSLFNGARIIFANDTEVDIRNKVFVANIVQIGTNVPPTITLSKAHDGDVSYNDQVIVVKGEQYQGKTFWFDGQYWNLGQQKTSVNQPPKFDIFDKNNISFSDVEYYPGTDFTGNTLLQYEPGSGPNDTILGFPIKYSSISNIGDLSFQISLNTETFNYVYNSESINLSVNNGYVHVYDDNTNYKRLIGWQTAVESSFQYQVFNLIYNRKIICDVAALSSQETNYPAVVVYIDNQRIDNSQYTVTIGTNSTEIIILSPPAIGTPVEILIHSDQVSPTAYYQIPSNFDHNPFSVPVTSINLGDLRGHYKSICNNITTLTGTAFGRNNFRDLGNLVPYGTRIIQNSSTLVLASIFLRSGNNNFFKGLTHSSTEYVKYKALIVDTVNKTDYNSLQSSANILDDVIDQITTTKLNSTAFFWSDMLPTTGRHTTKTYTFKSGISTTVFPLSRSYNFTSANYKTILVYLTRIVDGVIRTTQLIRDLDYSVTESLLTVTKDLIPDDLVKVVEYDQTYGSYVPNTPTKMGLYPKFIPEVILDTSYVTPTYFLKGHDGSLTRLYGEYNDGYLEDFRDKVLLEFETRIYNNMKVTARIPIEYDDIFPGQFRTTDYSREEIQQIYSTQFLNWVGLNRINYTEQQYFNTNEFTWNYSQSKNKLDNSNLQQGHWRGVYMWLYDTSTPESTPWEMLGLTNKPDWWETRYGEAPYTSDNILLWTDISNGYVYNAGSSYINKKRARPGLLKILPVDTNGKLLSPFDAVLNGYNQNTFNNMWTVGDVGPAEYSYLKSSTWPFDLMRLFALTKPGQFFTVAADLDEYKYDYEFNQYLTNSRFRVSPDKLSLYGNGESGASHGYFAWVVDYANQIGIDGSQLLSTYFNNTDVRLTYRMAGFSDKEFLRFFAEKGSPNSTNNSLLIPDESYSILLYQNEPYVSITYSSIIIQKSKNGYTVYGNSQEKALFTYNSPKLNGLYKTVSISNISLKLPTQYNSDEKTIPYGYEFKTLYDLATFIKGYGTYLENQGVKFNIIENGIELNWDQMVAELIYWVATGWEEGSTVNLNPNANSITIKNNYGTVQTLNANRNNFILNQNLVPIQIKDLGITRIDTTFTAKVLNVGDTVSFLHARVATTEHMVIFDNVTVFNDTMFNLVTGLRQQRLYVKGSKTSNWDGTLNAPGFIINQDNVLDWQENLKYNKGTIVKYKNEYWVADKVSIPPSSTFDVTQWKKTLYNLVSKGLLPNPSTKAYEATLFYDSNNANLKNDADLLSFSLIGYRPRKYFSQANLDDITQLNLYKTLIKSKGTRDSFDVLVGANLQKTQLDYNFHENWAIKRSEYGGILNKNFIELTLDKSLLTGNPAVVGIEHGETVPGLQQIVQLHDLKNYGYAIQNLNILPTIPSTTDSKLPSAGYVNIDDVRFTGYYISSLYNSDITTLYKNDYIWIADKIGEWKVYTPVIIDARLVTVQNNLNNTCTFIFDAPHNLSANDPFGIINFDSRINTYYVVNTVTNAKSLVVSLVLNAATTSINGLGILLSLVNQRVSVAKDILNLPLLNADYVKNKVWVDKNPDGEWNVLHKTNNYTHTEFTKPNSTVEFGSSMIYIDDTFGYFVTDAPAGKLYNYIESDTKESGYLLSRTITKYSGFGTSMVRQGDILIVSQPDPFGELSQIYVYKLVSNDRVYALVEEQVLSIAGFRIGDAMALSGDGMYLYTSIIDLNAVLLLQRDDDYAYYDIGLYLSDAVTPGSTQFTCYGNVRTTALEGRLISFTNAMFSDTFTIITSRYDSGSNKTTIYITSPIPYTVPSNSVVFRAVVNFRTVGALTSEGLATGTDMFSYSLATNNDGTKLFVGSPMSDFSVPWKLTDQGYTFMFDRLVENWEVVGDSPPEAFALFFMPWTPTVGSAVYINGVRLHPNTYVLVVNLLIMIRPLKSGDIVTVSSGNLVLVQELASYDTIEDIVPGQRFGWSLDTNKYGTELIVGSPWDHNKDNVEGRVYRFTNEGKRYGRITGILQTHLVEPASILINGYRVALPDGSEQTPADAIYVASKINEAVITNVFAYATEDGRLVIRLRDMNLGPVNNKLNITVFNGNVLAELGMVGYIKTEVISDPHKNTRSQFGYAVKFNEHNSFVVSAPVATRNLGTTFDFSDDENNHNDCVFDNNFTVFEDSDVNAGTVYMYDYIQSYGESLLTGGNYIYAQSLPDTVADYGKEPKYGQSLEFRNNVVMVGAPMFKNGTVNGRVVIHKNKVGTTNWSLFRESNPVVDITKIQKIQLYNNINDSNLLSLDYFDPLQGKLLGPIAENIDFISGVDPAGYNNSTANKGSVVWGKNDVGTIWFDVTYTKFMNYHQSDISYNSKYWGNVFPGSVVTVYSWIESDVMPSFYVGSGTPYDFGKYSLAFETDAGDNLITRYYYWVRNTGVLFTDRKKTLTDTVIEQYITNPQNSGIAYFAPLANNIYALYNSGDSIYSQQTNLHIGYSTNDVDIPGHQEYQLIRTDYPDDFLHGVPDGVNYLKPEGLYNKLLNSFAGEDEFGAVVPNPYLPKLYQIGVSVRPNQSLFVDRFNALKNYLSYANTLLKNYPIAETSTLTLLHTYDDTFDTTKYWRHVYWWAEGYSDLSKTITEVPKYYNLSLLTPKEGLIVGVTSNSQGNREVYKYTTGDWVRIGLENGTIEFLSKIWDYQTNKTGFGDNFFDTVSFDSFPSKETRYIIRALNEQIYIGDLHKYKNKSLILMFEYIQSENIASHNYLPWLNKTSLADVSYKIRELLPFQKYQSDNLGLLEGYLNEVKPYHTVLKEFYFNYVGSEQFQGDISDFDLPAIYNEKYNKFVSPKLLYNNVSPGSYDELAINDNLWNTTPEYGNWYNNFGLKLQSNPNQLIAILDRYTSNVAQELYVDNAHGLPAQALIKIDNELISYTRVDRERGKLYGLSRGVNNTKIAVHLPNTNIYSDLEGVIILDTARGYIDRPIVRAYIDTSIYPAPKRDAVLQAVMSGDRVVSINVIDPGEGYAVTPEIIFQSSFDVSFTEEEMNFTSSLLVLILDNDLATGDLIKVTSNGTNSYEAIIPGYYYLRVLGFNNRSNRAVLFSSKPVVTLHYTNRDAMSGEHRVIFKPNTNNAALTYKLSMVPRALAFTSNAKVREITTTIRMDRTSYNSQIQPWDSGIFWPSPFNSLGNDSSTNIGMSDGIEYEFLPEDAGTLYSISSATGIPIKFVVYNETLVGIYAATITTLGTGYIVGDTITVLGENLGGATPTNNCVITVSQVNINGGITRVTVTGTPLSTSVTLASFQGAVIPLLSKELDTNDQGTIITVKYGDTPYMHPSLRPGQIKGLRMYFYRLLEPYIYDDTAGGGALINIYRPRFTPNAVTSQYYMKIINPGSIYLDDDQIIIRGGLLGGTDYVNDAIINVVFGGGESTPGAIQISNITGIPSAPIGFYYVMPISATQLKVYKDSSILQPVLHDDFIFDGLGANTQNYKDYVYIPEPLFAGGGYKYVSSAVVSYNDNVYRCIESNSDEVFDYAKWKLVQPSDRSLNALDRVVGYYKPTGDMLPKELSQIFKGITYPNNIYYGNSFAPDEELPLDFEVKDQPFYPRDLSIKAIYHHQYKLDPTDSDYVHEYIAIGETNKNSIALISDDGETWSTVKISDQLLGVTDITYSGTYFIISTTNINTPVLLSVDRANWLTVGTNTSYDFTAYDYTGYDVLALQAPKDKLYATLYVNNVFFGVGNDILRSTDGIGWTLVYEFGSQLPNQIKSIAYAEIKNFIGYVAVGNGYSVTSQGNTAAPTITYSAKLLTSLDGVVWTKFDIPFSLSGMNIVVSSDSIIVASGENGEIWYSTNANNWIQATSPINDTIRDGYYANGIFILVGGDTSGAILKSANGMTWTDVSSGSNVLNGITHDGTYFYAVGDNGSMLRSTNGNMWVDISFIQTEDPQFQIKGSDFLYGYGPEELTPAIVNDSLSLRVTTLPGGWWDVDTTTQNFLYKYTGFNAVSKVVKDIDIVDLEVSFDGLVLNPAQLSVYILNDDTSTQGHRIYEDITTANNTVSYSIDWINKIITLSDPIDSGASLLIEVYEIGNGRQLARSTSDRTPMTIDENTSNSTIVFSGIKYQYLETPIVYHNGTRLVFQTDYDIVDNGKGYLQLLFNEVYDPDVDFISYAVLADSTTDYNIDVHYGYTIPETEVFVYDSTNVFTLSNYVGPDNFEIENIGAPKATHSGNEDNMIVEINGFRLSSTDYSIDLSNNELTITASLSADDIVAVTTFNDTKRQYFKTDTTTSMRTFNIHSFQEFTSINVSIFLTEDAGFVVGDEVCIVTTREDIDPSDTYLVTFKTVDVVGPATYYRYELAPTGSGYPENYNNYEGEAYITLASNSLSITTTYKLFQKSGDTTYFTPEHPERSIITIDGQKVDSSCIRSIIIKSLDTHSNTYIPTETYVFLATPIGAGQNVIVTSMCANPTPNETSYTINSDKLGNGRIYGTNVTDRSWLLSDLTLYDDIIYVKDVSMVTGDRNIVEINGEKIRYTTVDMVANTLSGLTRGVQGTGPLDIQTTNSYIYGVSSKNTLAQTYYNEVWNSKNYTTRGDPLQLTVSDPVAFLKLGII